MERTAPRTIALAALCLAFWGGVAAAAALPEPGYRGKPNSLTVSFSIFGPDTVAPTVGANSEYPLAFPNATQDIDPISGEATYTIPNFVDDLPLKFMRITVWQNCNCYDVAGTPVVSALEGAAAASVTYVGSGDNFSEIPEPDPNPPFPAFYLYYDYIIRPNPDSEIVKFAFDFDEFSTKVERITFDTISTVPLPGSVLLMLSAMTGLGGIASKRRKRKKDPQAL